MTSSWEVRMRARRWPWALLAVALCAPAIGCTAKAKVQATAAPTPPPKPADSDGDGIPDDGTDKCLLEKEDGLPPAPKDGCLSTDADADGIPDDGTDHCRGDKEDGLGPEPRDGCPTTDPDKDGIAGKADKCPEEPETRNGHQDDDGCPDKAPRVQVTKSEVKIGEKILFSFGKATIEKESDGLLDEIAEVLQQNPQIEFIEVAGHADKIGADPGNVALTRQRAAAVHAALVRRGVDGRRMRPQGYGRYCQIDPGDSEEAREKNRRVEFKIMRVDGVETGVALGCDEAAKHGIKPAGIPKSAPRKPEIEKTASVRGTTKFGTDTPAGAKPAAPAPAKAPPKAAAKPPAAKAAPAKPVPKPASKPVPAKPAPKPAAAPKPTSPLAPMTPPKKK